MNRCGYAGLTLGDTDRGLEQKNWPLAEGFWELAVCIILSHGEDSRCDDSTTKVIRRSLAWGIYQAHLRITRWSKHLFLVDPWRALKSSKKATLDQTLFPNSSWFLHRCPCDCSPLVPSPQEPLSPGVWLKRASLHSNSFPCFYSRLLSFLSLAVFSRYLLLQLHLTRPARQLPSLWRSRRLGIRFPGEAPAAGISLGRSGLLHHSAPAFLLLLLSQQAVSWYSTGQVVQVESNSWLWYWFWCSCVRAL